jgi:hypothetical protein
MLQNLQWDYLEISKKAYIHFALYPEAIFRATLNRYSASTQVGTSTSNQHLKEVESKKRSILSNLNDRVRR